MELRVIGEENRPPVLFMPGSDWDEKLSSAALRALRNDYCLLIPDAEEEADPAALEEALLRDTAGALWGAYGLNDGAEALLTLLNRDALDIRTRVVEGRFSLPDDTPGSGREIRCWTGYKDKKGKQSLEALRADGWQAAALTLKKLPKEKSTMAYCPSLATKQLKKAFGTAQCVSRTAVLPAGPERVLALLGEKPDAREAARLDRAAPVHCDEKKRTVLYEGSGAGLPVWYHLIRLEAVDDRHTRCTDRIYFRSSGKDGPVTEKSVRRHLLRLHILRLLALLGWRYAL